MLWAGRINVGMDASVIEKFVIQDVSNKEITLLERWARHPYIAVIARILQ
jgi:hypothetical protein